MLPNLITAGFTRCGTSSLHYYLSQHPDIFMSKKKEINFFNKNKNFNKGLPFYESYFSGGEPFPFRGESTPMYAEKGVLYDDSDKLLVFKKKSALVRIKKAIPHCKIVLIMRSPVDRYISMYKKNLFQGKNNIIYPPLKYLEKELNTPLETYSFLYKLKYKLHLQELFRLFPKYQVHLVIFDDLEKNPSKVLKELFEFLGIDSEFASKINYEKCNTAKVYSRFSFTKAVYLFLKSDRSLLKYFLAKKKKMVFGVSFRKKIVEYVEEDIEYVERLTDRQLDGWKII